MAINILKEPRDKEYEKLIEYAFKICKTFVLSIHREMLIFYPEPAILSILEPYKINEQSAINYPKINYYDYNAIFYFYECNEYTKLIVMQAVNGLYEWKHPGLPEDLTFLNDNGDVWLYSISHESMGGIYERDGAEVEVIKHELGLDVYWIEKVYTENEVGDAMNSMFRLIREYFYLLGSISKDELSKDVLYKENSTYYGFWNDYFSDYNISEHSLAFEIACFSDLLKLKEPIYANDFSELLNSNDNYHLVQLLVKNINGNEKILKDYLENFKSIYSYKK